MLCPSSTLSFRTRCGQTEPAAGDVSKKHQESENHMGCEHTPSAEWVSPGKARDGPQPVTYQTSTWKGTGCAAVIPSVRAAKAVPKLCQMKSRLNTADKFCSCKDKEVPKKLPGEMEEFPAQEDFHNRLDSWV